jgi:arylsulfatase A-like enzyme
MPGPRTLLLWTALAASCGGASVERAPADAPNVLLITIDTLRADRLGLYGYAKPTSPALDDFAAGAVVFEQAEASSPWTLPSLASVMTSEVVSTHNCWNYTSVLDDSFLTLPERLLAAGYDTACVVSHLFTTSRHGLQQGFVHTDDSYAYPEIDPVLNITSQVISDKAIRFLDQKVASPDKAPWLLWLHYFDPHKEYMAHAGLTESFVTPGERSQGVILGDVYDGEVRYTDDHVGRVLAHLAELGLAEGTLVVLLADHGEEFEDHGGSGHGHSLHTEVVRVPLVLRAPGIAPRRVPELARQVDVLPTVLELVGLSTPPGLAGHSLVPLMKGAGAAPTAGALAELDIGPLLSDSWRTERWRLIRTGAAEERVVRLYDLVADPRETKDVAAEHPDVVQALLAALEAAKAAGRERAKLFETTTLGQTPATQDDLHGLGYVGEELEKDAEEEPGK